MTTKVTVDAHAGWDVIVEQHHHSGAVQEYVVPAYQTRDFYVHSTMDLKIRESVRPVAKVE